ncbi:MAG: dienelactone hydrolase family protein [Gammaproteobacteria bacterium AqS3]|nr:dienelactone hydrolase family protein [Gammaproteobacteria bacterium AqS3]
MTATRTLNYSDAGLEFKGYLAAPDELSGSVPGVLVCHAWGGQKELEREYAERLAGLGYVGLAVDMYGGGRTGDSYEENAELMNAVLSDRGVLRARIQAAHEALAGLDEVDASRTGCLGFCFGGLTALDLARSGAGVQGVISFHGALAAPEDMRCVKNPEARFLVLHGDADPMVSGEDVSALQQELRDAGADWQINIYGNAMHSFTNPESQAPDMGLQYDKATAERSWRAARDFFAELFG